MTSVVKSADDRSNGMDLGKLIGVIFIDLKKLSTLPKTGVLWYTRTGMSMV